MSIVIITFTLVFPFEDKTDEEIIDGILSINTYRGKHNIDILKGNKKLTELVRKVNLKFPLIKEKKNDNDWYRCREDFKLMVE